MVYIRCDKCGFETDDCPEEIKNCQKWLHKRLKRVKKGVYACPECGSRDLTED
jgi:DNA-directed RNA polymerase subunit RPC12/RpoP